MSDDPVALAREAMERARYHMECSFGYGNTEKMESDPDAHLYSRIATYLENLSAPGEDEEKLCREILFLELDRWGTAHRSGNSSTCHHNAAIAAMREYARRLRPTIKEPT